MSSKPTASAKDQSKSERTRSRILDAAAHVLCTKGFAGTRLTDVAEHAQLQAPAIYYYFSSREDLIEEAMFRGINDLRVHLQRALNALPPDTAPMDQILTAAEIHLRHGLELSDYARASIRNSGQIPDRLRARQKKELNSYSRIWQRLMAAATAAGQIRNDLDPKLAQALILGALNWSAEWWDPRRNSVDMLVTNAQVFIRHSLSPAAKPSRSRVKGRVSG
ncbi:MAG: TetR/AcrR family transcriptional regulator [Mycobacterium sp.]